MSSPLLDIAQKYYDVAADLKANGLRALETAESLNKIADAICEQNMRRTPDASEAGAKGEE